MSSLQWSQRKPCKHPPFETCAGAGFEVDPIPSWNFEENSTSKHQIGRHLGDLKQLPQIRELVRCSAIFFRGCHGHLWRLTTQRHNVQGEATCRPTKTVPWSSAKMTCFKNFHGQKSTNNSMFRVQHVWSVGRSWHKQRWHTTDLQVDAGAGRGSSGQFKRRLLISIYIHIQLIGHFHIVLLVVNDGQYMSISCRLFLFKSPCFPRIPIDFCADPWRLYTSGNCVVELCNWDVLDRYPGSRGLSQPYPYLLPVLLMKPLYM